MNQQEQKYNGAGLN